MKTTRVTIRFEKSANSAAARAEEFERPAVRRIIRAILESAARQIALPGLCFALDILLTDDAGIRQLNRDFRGIDRATDGLSFPQFSPEESREFWAEKPPVCFAGKRGRRAGPPGGQLISATSTEGVAAAARVSGQAIPLGDLALSLPTIIRQARRGKHPIERELSFVLAHGFLHLIGCDHNTPARRRDMWRLGWRIVRQAEKQA